ncbi:MAG: ATP-binding protein [Phycisphaerae bacterium]|nr:ATP-binding protein [Phycisphaerae bacterium]
MKGLEPSTSTLARGERGVARLEKGGGCGSRDSHLHSGLHGRWTEVGRGWQWAANRVHRAITRGPDKRAWLDRAKSFGNWGAVFANDAVMASAALDRLLHKAAVLNIRGESYRLRERRKAIGSDALPGGPEHRSEQPMTRASAHSRGTGGEEGGEHRR